MANDYYNNTTNTLIDGNIASAQDVEAKADDIAAGFDLVAVDVGSSIKLTNEDAGIVELSESLTARANKTIGFDGNGDATLIASQEAWRGDYTVGTYYTEGDIVRDTEGLAGAGVNALLYANTTHTASGLDTDEILYWVAIVDVTVLDEYILKANKWAVEAEDTLVNDGTNPTDYSAYHYAQKAKLLTVEQLAALDAQINAGTVVDIEIYDVTQDDDGGAWTEQVRHTSWYNEALNTADRGATRDFPKLSIIVAEAATTTIYDATDPTVPMWMVFEEGNNSTYWNGLTATNNFATGVTMKNGVLYKTSDTGLRTCNFITEYKEFIQSSNYRSLSGSISERNGGLLRVSASGVDFIISLVLNNVAVISDGKMGNTVAVTADLGISFIYPDGSVYDLTTFSSEPQEIVAINNEKFVAGYVWNAHYAIHEPVTADAIVSGSSSHYYFQYSQATTEPTIPKLLDSIGARLFASNGASGGSAGLTLVDEADDYADTMVCPITSSWNAGWLKGDIRRAFLADTVAETLVDGELVINGTFPTNTSGWTPESGSGTPVLSVVAGELVVDHNASATFGRAVQGITTVVGQTYQVSGDYIHTGFGGALRVTTSSNGSSSGQLDITSTLTANGKLVSTFVATTTTTYIALICDTSNTSATAKFDNVTMSIAEEDRSVKAGSLAVTGSITKTAVKTGAELVGYSGFSSLNYLKEAYNSELDFGTDAFYCCGWYRWDGTAATDTFLFDRRRPTADNYDRFSLRIDSSGFLKAAVSDGLGGLISNNSVFTPEADVWNFFTFIRDTNGNLFLYNNAELKDEVSGTGDISINADAELYVGCSVAAGPAIISPWLGEAALLRYGSGTLSLAQMNKIYNDETFLFQENAACTINGTSDSVQSMAYDKVTDELTIGTSGGLSTFKRLKRVDEDASKTGKTSLAAHNSILVDGV